MMISLLAGCIFFVAGFVQGLTGFGSALVAIPLLSLILDIKAAVPLCILNGLIITMYLALHLRQHLDRTKILPLVVGSIPGVVVGATLLQRVDSGIIRFCIGVLLISYSLYNLFVRPRSPGLSRAWGYAAGFLTGAIGAAFSAGGPPAIIYTTLAGWKKEEIRATLSGFFVANGIVTAVVHVVTGVSTVATVQIFLVTAPFVLLGTVAGSHVTGKINQQTYLRIIYTFLILMGIMMILQ
ncbi:MAG TPA: sulfite exporter TauE/SafE family protein [Desulfobulbaceae bacterium]|nr:sulfite exporter TauE/SafE family protein [Desulfobulbaceae bacterium]